MRIDFEVDGAPATFQWDVMTAATTLTVDGQSLELQSPRSPSSHFSASLRRTWERKVGERNVTIVKVRPLLFAYMRPNLFTVSVDRKVVAEARGL